MPIFHELLSPMIEDPLTVSCALDLILIVRYVERIADQATDISKEVVYLVEAAPVLYANIAGEK